MRVQVSIVEIEEGNSIKAASIREEVELNAQKSSHVFNIDPWDSVFIGGQKVLDTPNNTGHNTSTESGTPPDSAGAAPTIA